MPEKLKVLLINPFFLFFLEDRYDLEKIQNSSQFVQPPLGLGSLSAYIKDSFNNVDIEVYDANAAAVTEILNTNKVDMDQLWDLVKEKVNQFSPDIVGISALFEFSGNMALKFADLVKEVNKDIITLMGGAYASYSYKRAFNNQNLDYVIKGEGEEPFKQFIEYILGKRKIQEVGSLIYRENTNIESNPCAFVKDLDQIPTIDRSNFFMDLYATYSVRIPERYTPVHYPVRLTSLATSRGCPFKCAFCSTRLLWGDGIRYRSISDIIAEIKQLKSQHGINTLFFLDESINVNKKRFIEFLKELKKLKIKWYGCGLQVVTITEEIVELCVESGLLYFEMSFESGSNEILRKMHKPLTIEQAERAVQIVRKVARDKSIFGAFVTGFPFEKLEHIDQTISFARQLDLDWSGFYSCQPYPGTEIYQICLDRGYIKETEDTIKNPVPLLHNALTTENFTAQEVIERNYRANLDLNFLNNRNLCGRGRLEQAFRDFSDIIHNYPNQVFAHYCLSKYFQQKDNSQEADNCLKRARTCAKVDPFYQPYIRYFGLEELLLGEKIKK